ncbi:MAG: hypothetical protein M3256_15325 [Actinomycetota bacterium]|nr:hypothetical protein [Actinomycetota bacterium]
MRPPGYSTLTAAQARQRAPLAWAKVSAAEDELSRRWHFGCRHVLRAGVVPPAAMFCTDHPGSGVMCEECMRRYHLPRHSDVEELTCDECRQVAEALVPMACMAVLSGVKLRESRGRTGTFAGTVAFMAVGVCLGCWNGTADAA